MFGFVFGFACLCGLVHMVRGGRHGRWGRHGHWRRGGFGSSRWGRYGMLRGLFERLDTTPGQERVIRNAVDEVMEAAQQMRGELWGARSQVGKAFRSETLDAETLADILSQHDDALSSLRATFVGALAKVHEALDPEQRERLSDWMDRQSSCHHNRHHGPYRHAA